MNSQEQSARFFNPCGVDYSSIETTQKVIMNKSKNDKPFDVIKNYYHIDYINSAQMFLNQ